MKVLLPHDVPPAALGSLPSSIELTGERAPDVEFLVAGHSGADELAQLLEHLPSLRIVQTLSAGIDWLPPIPAGVTVCNGSGIHDIPVAEWCVAAILAMNRRLPDFLALQAEGRWNRDASGPITELEGAGVLVLGHGSIGRTLETRLEPFGARVTGVAKHERPGVRTLAEVPGLLPHADVVVVLLPLSEETRGLVDGRFLDRMRPGALLVNAARGGLVDTAALEERLRSGRLRAALDVTDPEPLPPEHSLWSAPNFLLTPHVAGGTSRSDERGYRFVGDQLRRAAAGEPLLNLRGEY